MKIDTRLWSIGFYPMPDRPKKTPAELVEELRGFHHYAAADLLEQLLQADADRLAAMSEHTELRMRVGSSVGRTLYLQRGEEPSGLDDLVGMVDTPDLAHRIAEAWNEYWPEPDASNLGLPTHVDEVKRKAVDLGQQVVDG